MAVTNLRIPDSHRDDLALLLTLNDSQMQALVNALDTIVVTSSSAFAEQASVPNVPPAELARMFNALRALYTVRGHENADVKDFVDSLLRAMQNTRDAKLSVAGGDVETVKNRLVKLLSATAFSVSVKAQDLASEFQHMLYGARILTDLRPVFRESASDQPVGMLIVQTLKLEYHSHDYEHQTFYVTIPDDVLLDLKNAITRALQKAEALQSRLRDSGITYLDQPEDN